MREEIEAVITEFKSRQLEARRDALENNGKMIGAWHEGRCNELGLVLNKLKEVLANADNPSEPIPTDTE